MKTLTLIYQTFDKKVIYLHRNSSVVISNKYENDYGLLEVQATEEGELPSELFAGATLLTSIQLPDGITIIPSSFFADCKSIEKITIPQSVTKICSHAFYNDKDLREVILPKSLVIIDKGAFWRCSSLQHIQLPDTVEVIEHSAFRECKSLEIDELPVNLKHVGNWAFSGCRSLRISKLPNQLIRVDLSAFEGATIGDIVFPNNLSSLSGHSGIEKAHSITVPDNHPYFLKDLNCIIRKSDYSLITTIGERISPPFYVKKIAPYAFYKSEVLEVSFYGRLEEIGEEAFAYCKSISNIHFPNTIKRIGKRAFSESHINHLQIPDSVEAIEDEAFLYSYIDELFIDCDIKPREVVREAVYNSHIDWALCDSREFGAFLSGEQDDLTKAGKDYYCPLTRIRVNLLILGNHCRSFNLNGCDYNGTIIKVIRIEGPNRPELWGQRLPKSVEKILMPESMLDELNITTWRDYIHLTEAFDAPQIANSTTGVSSAPQLKQTESEIECADVETYLELAFKYDSLFEEDGVNKDDNIAISYYEKAANKGSEVALHYLGLHKWTKDDGDAALEYFKKAYKKGYVESGYCLGRMYYYGINTQEDKDLGIHYFEETAEYGHPLSSYNLGLIYANSDKEQSELMFLYTLLVWEQWEPQEDSSILEDVIAKLRVAFQGKKLENLKYKEPEIIQVIEKYKLLESNQSEEKNIFAIDSRAAIQYTTTDNSPIELFGEKEFVVFHSFDKGVGTIVLKQNTIPLRAFKGKQSLSEAIIRGPLKVIGEAAFQDCVNLKHIIIPDTVERINAYAFYGCKALTELVLPSGLLNCGERERYLRSSSGRSLDMMPEPLILIDSDLEKGKGFALSTVTINTPIKGIYSVLLFGYEGCTLILEKNLYYVTVVNWDPDAEFLGAAPFYYYEEDNPYILRNNRCHTIVLGESVSYIGPHTLEDGLYEVLELKSPIPPQIESSFAPRLKSIIVPVGSKERYLSVPFWAAYASIINEK